MRNPVESLFKFLRTKWRWAHGRCPLCNRQLYASSPASVVGPSNCPACKDSTTADLRMGVWGGLADFSAEADLVSDPAVCPGRTDS
jgi:hypothetical protein